MGRTHLSRHWGAADATRLGHARATCSIPLRCRVQQ